MTIGATIGGLIAAVARACGRRPLVTVTVSLALAVAASFYTVHALTFLSDPLRLLPQHEPYVVRLKEFQRDFGELNDIVVVVESATADLSKGYAAHLTSELRRAGLTSQPITYRIDPAYFDRRALLYLSVDDLTKLRDRLFDSQEFLETYAAHPTLPQLLEGLNQQIANQMVLGFFDVGLGGERSSDLRFLEAVIDQISARLDGPSPYTSAWGTAFSVGRLDDPDAGYFFSSDRHWLFVLVQEEGSYAEKRRSIATIRSVIARLKGEFPDVQAGVTGSPTISNDEMSTAFDDSKVATALAFVLTLVLLVAAFRRVFTPLLILATLAVSLGWSLGIITLVVGHLSIFSVMFISIVVGIGTDYGIYFLFRYEEEVRLRWRPADALRRAGERAGPGMLLGALTAAGAFVVLMLTDFQGIREFGFVSATAILMAFLSMITLLPALLALADRRRGHTATATGTVREATWLLRITRYRKTIMVGALGLTAFAVWGAVRVDFSYNMLKLQAKGVESVVWEERILAKAGRSGFAALTRASSLDELRRKRDAFAALPSVAKVESVLMLVPDRQPEKDKLIKQFAPLVEPVQVGADHRPPAGGPSRASSDAAPALSAGDRGGERESPSRDPARPGQARGAARQARPRRRPTGRSETDRSSRGRWRATSPTSCRTSRRTSTRGPSSQARRRPSCGGATSDGAGGTCSASTRPWTSGSRRARSASSRTSGRWIPTSPAPPSRASRPFSSSGAATSRGRCTPWCS